MGLLASVLILALLAAGIAGADNGKADADVVQVDAIDRGEAGWTFEVTVNHPDTGWTDYCNGWDVVTDDGEVLKRNPEDEFTRLLLHPHENEQPFTRSQGGLNIPPGTRTLTVRAHDLVEGFGGREVVIDLDTNSGPGYTISR